MPAEETSFALSAHTEKEHLRHTFEQIYYDHATALFRYGTQFKASTALVEDCVQELFADLWERRATLEAIRSMRSYLLGALRRKILQKTYASREQLLDSEDLFTLVDQRAAENLPANISLSEEVTEQLTTSLRQLTQKQQEVLYLRFYNQLSFREIADIMSVQTRTVYKLCHRAIATLNAHLSEAVPIAHLLLVLLTYFGWVK